MYTYTDETIKERVNYKEIPTNSELIDTAKRMAIIAVETYLNEEGMLLTGTVVILYRYCHLLEDKLIELGHDPSELLT